MDTKVNREVIKASAREIYPKVNWHVTEPFGNPNVINIMGTISFYAQTNLEKANLAKVEEHASKMIAIEIEGAYAALEALIQDWLEK